MIRRTYKTSFLVALIAVAFFACTAQAKDYSITAPDSLTSLNHDYYYNWGISWSPDSSAETITSASITFHNIYNWQPEDNRLYVHLFDTMGTGVTPHSDSAPGLSDQWSPSSGSQTVLYNNGNAYWKDTLFTGQDVTFNILSDQFSWLKSGNNFGFGVDPDCHFYDTSVTVSITTQNVPEPASFIFLLAGCCSFIGVKRCRKKI